MENLTNQVYWLHGFKAVIVILIIFIIYLLFEKQKHIKNEKKLRDEMQFLRTVINSLPDIVCFKDGRGRWIEANEAILDLYGTDSSIIGKTHKEIAELLPQFEEELRVCESTDLEIWHSGKTGMIEEEFHSKGENKRTFEVIKVPLFNEDGSKKGLVVVGREITDRKKSDEIKRQAEENHKLINDLKEYDAIRTEFFANLSHELRTPLNMIMAPIQLIELMPQNKEKVMDCVGIIKQNCFRLIRLINNIIDITKIDSGYITMSIKRHNIISLIEDTVISASSYIENMGLELVFDTEIEEKFMYVDADKLERIILNLLSNAIKFTDQGGSIFVNIYDLKDKIRISVKDTGIGIPESRQTIVFERFVQVDKSLSRNAEGSGIGLSLVKAFVEKHGGKVSINNEYKEGTEFVIDIPVDYFSEKDCIVQDCCKYGGTLRNKIEIANIEFSDIYS